jgi:hypothetical protein
MNAHGLPGGSSAPYNGAVVAGYFHLDERATFAVDDLAAMNVSDLHSSFFH